MNATNTNLTPWVMEKFIAAAPADAAKAMAALATHEAVLLLKPLKVELIVACLNFMEPVKAAAVLRRLPSRQGAHVLSRLNVEQAAFIFEAFSVPQKEKMKVILSASFIKTIQTISAWPEGSVGKRMSTDFFAFRTEAKLSEIIEKLKVLPRKKLPQACLVVDKNGKSKGVIRSAELAFYAPNSTVGSVMTEVKTLLAQQDSQKGIALLEMGQPLVPVTDKEGVVLGVLYPENSAKEKKRKKRFIWF